ncbi:MAG: IS6 family transposase [Serratia symbiotica]|nr:IS6 family transposase [Serratia symbiotica]
MINTEQARRSMRPNVEHQKIKYRNNLIKCDHGKLNRIISTSLEFKTIKTTYAIIKGIKVMRTPRKRQAHRFIIVIPLGRGI